MHSDSPTDNEPIVDLKVVDGRLAVVRLRGADPHLQTVATALTGLPADLSAAAFAAHIRAAVPFSHALDLSPLELGQVLRQAVGGPEPDPHRVGLMTSADLATFTSRWAKVTWDLIAETLIAPVTAMALDEVLVESVATGRRPATLRFWQWAQPAVVIGRTQSLANEIDAEVATELGLQIVRRMTGGGAMFVQRHGAITFSLYLPEHLVAGLSVRQSYEVCDAWVVRGLRALGIDAHHVPINDIAWADGKIGGAAQARRSGVVLHHATLAYAMEAGEMTRVLRIGRAKLRDRGTASAAKRVSPLDRQIRVSREVIRDHLFHTFQTEFGGAQSEVTNFERNAADDLGRAKYGSSEWTGEFA